jgi:hypothetical protein
MNQWFWINLVEQPKLQNKPWWTPPFLPSRHCPDKDKENGCAWHKHAAINIYTPPFPTPLLKHHEDFFVSLFLPSSKFSIFFIMDPYKVMILYSSFSLIENIYFFA